MQHGVPPASRLLVACLLFTVLTSPPLYAQITGKIIGVVYDAETLAPPSDVNAEVRF